MTNPRRVQSAGGDRRLPSVHLSEHFPAHRGAHP